MMPGKVLKGKPCSLLKWFSNPYVTEIGEEIDGRYDKGLKMGIGDGETVTMTVRTMIGETMLDIRQKEIRKDFLPAR